MKRALFVILALYICTQPIFAANNSWSEGADINNDGIVDYKDFAIMSKYWLQIDPNIPDIIPDITWIHVNDDGSGMKDDSGNPIYQGGFQGDMSKYETTNDQYCLYLNTALDSGDIYISEGIVYGNSGEYIDQVYFKTFEMTPASQITFDGSRFTVQSRDGYYMGNHPVVMVSWYGATAFCNYYGWKLPTQWQWQAVADNDGEFIYGCGTTVDHSKANYNLGNPLGLTSYPHTSPVDYYPSYGYGFNDMTGNIWEWTSSVSQNDRVTCGGSWLSSNYYSTVSSRGYKTPYFTSYSQGFRVCR